MSDFFEWPYPKDPNEALDYKFDFAGLTNGTGIEDVLVSGETIATIDAITADSGITVDSSSRTDADTSVTVWLSGGLPGASYKVACKITTDSTPVRTYERTGILRMKER